MPPDLLILVQVDDATGETLQHATERVVAAGARNVQVLGTTTKKGRPGHVCLIDLPAEREDDVAAILAVELGAWGYHILESRHRHFDIKLETRSVRVEREGQALVAQVRCKYIRRAGRLLAVKADHEDLVRLQVALAQRGIDVAVRVLRAGCEREVWRAPDADGMVVDL
jgi:pyridinium-3,5-bisthiocarboxylic acid mononucleotide nickel chelatase